jgi:hypothetical protein
MAHLVIPVREEEFAILCTCLIRGGSRIHAVKFARAAYGWGLQEALEWTKQLVPSDSAQPPIPENTVPVRVAVAMSKIGPDDPWEVHAWGRTGATDATMIRNVNDMIIGAVFGRAWATIHAPLPNTPEVTASVEGVDRG